MEEKTFSFKGKNVRDADKLFAELRREMKKGYSLFITAEISETNAYAASWIRDAVAGCRKQKGLTQLEVAQKVGIGRKEITDFERGKSTPKCWKEILKVCNVRLVRDGFPLAYFDVFDFGEAAELVRFKIKMPYREAAKGCGIPQIRYRDFEKGKEELTFEETERVLTFLGFYAIYK